MTHIHLKPTTLKERCRSWVAFYRSLEDWTRRMEATCGENPIPENSITGQSLRGALALFDEVRPRIEKLATQIQIEPPELGTQENDTND